MKKVLLILALASVFAPFAQAENNPEKSAVKMAAYKTGDAKAVKVIVVNNEVETVTVRIKDANGRVLFTDVIRNEEKFIRKYVFPAELQHSDYTIEVTNGQGTASQFVAL